MDCTEPSNDMNDVLKIFINTIQMKKYIVFDNMIADILIHKKFQIIEVELFIRNWKRKIYFALITEFYFAVLNKIRLKSRDYIRF